MEPFVVAAVGLLGLAFGSFGNVVIHRVPRGESIVAPPSACPACATPIRPRDNIPVLSWLLLGGRCRDCAEPISPRYPLVELVMGLVFAAVAARVGLDWALPGFLLFAWLLVVVAIIDAQTRKIPNRLTYPLTPTLLVLLGLAALLEGTPGLALRALLGGLAAFAGLLVLALAAPGGMGMGDVKLAASIGIALGYLGWGHLLVGVGSAFLLGGVFAVVLLAVGRAGRKDQLPFGPYLSAGALLALLAGDRLIDVYLQITGLG